MAYKARKDRDGAIHHVTNRGVRKASTFEDDADRRYFLRLLGRLPAESHLEVLAYCLMGSHFHLLLRNSGGSLSDGMHLVGTRYAKRFNWRHGYDGPLFKSRFYSSLVDSEAYLMTASRYIRQNPSELGFAGRLVEYPWSSYGAYVGVVGGPSWLATGYVLGLFSSDREAYGRFIDSDLAVGPKPAVPALGEVEAVVGRLVAPISSRSRRRIDRLMAMALAVELTDLTPADLAEAYGLSGPGVIRQMGTRFRRYCEDIPGLVAVANAARIELTRSVPGTKRVS